MSGAAPSGIATCYRGITFRSRLEATWAAFFDQLGWRWDYEGDPVGRWLPDFVIHAPHAPGGILRVEVKPTFDRPHYGQSPFRKAELSKSLPDDPEVLALGLSPFRASEYDQHAAAIGWLLQYAEGDGWTGIEWREAVLHGVGGYGVITDLDTTYPRETCTNRMSGATTAADMLGYGVSMAQVDRLWGWAKGEVRYQPGARSDLRDRSRLLAIYNDPLGVEARARAQAGMRAAGSEGNA